jgi:hypothetical protein
MCCVVLAMVAGCVTPARDDMNYSDKAAQALKAAASETSTVKLVLDQVLHGQILENYADQTVSDNEDSLSSVQDQFSSVQPPATDQADKLRDATTKLLAQAGDAVQAARIALRRGDRAALTASTKDLTAINGKLQDAEQAAVQ